MSKAHHDTTSLLVMKAVGHRRLHRGHFAFMRALAQGLDEASSWERYLRLEGEHTDLRTVRRTIDWIRDAFAAAARREAKPGTARLILLDTNRFNWGAALPSLEDFSADRGLQDFSEAEQIEAYQAFLEGEGGGRQGGAGPGRRARLIDRQLEALRWLEELTAQDPRPGDGVDAWLNPSMAQRLKVAGVPTLFALVERINGLGQRWWIQVPGIGERKAGRIVEWLLANERVLGLSVGRHVMAPRTQLATTTLAAVVPPGTALLPYEKFMVPAALDGRSGKFRAPAHQCLLMAENDHQAIGAWLAAKSPQARGQALTPTQRAYRKEAERLLLWTVLERNIPMSSLTVEDVTAYRDFLANPPAAWCGPRHHQRWSPLWRPLEGALSPAALRHALVILKSLFSFLVSQNYLVGNPFAGVAPPKLPVRPLGSSKTLTFDQWDYLDARLEGLQDTEPNRRLRRAIRWLYATGMRLAEIGSLRCGDLERLEFRTKAGEGAYGWMLSVVGKGSRSREIPVPEKLVLELQDELARHGYERLVTAVSNQQVPVLARFQSVAEHAKAWSESGLYKAIRTFVAEAADDLPPDRADRIRRVSTHWLRHSHGSHALQGRPGHAAVPIQVVQNNLGHASVGTTSGYLKTEKESRLQAMSEFWA